MNVPKVLCIIVTYNGMKWLDKCLSSVKNSTLKAELFIVDNGSTDGSIDFIKDNYPDAVLVESKENLGFGRANNLGFQYALDHEYDYVYLLNQDAWIESNVLNQIITINQNNQDFGILSPLQTNNEKNKLDTNFLKYACPNELLSDALCHNSLKQVYATDFVMAAHWMIPSSTLKKVGGFSPTFTHYAEDNNYIDRIHYWGLLAGIVPNVIGVHDREYRPSSVNKSIHIISMHWRRYLSNPISSKKTDMKNLTTSFLSAFRLHPLITLKKAIICLIQLRSIKFNYRLSKIKGAFLNIPDYD